MYHITLEKSISKSVKKSCFFTNLAKKATRFITKSIAKKIELLQKTAQITIHKSSSSHEKSFIRHHPHVKGISSSRERNIILTGQNHLYLSDYIKRLSAVLAKYDYSMTIYEYKEQAAVIDSITKRKFYSKRKYCLLLFCKKMKMQKEVKCEN